MISVDLHRYLQNEINIYTYSFYYSNEIHNWTLDDDTWHVCLCTLLSLWDVDMHIEQETHETRRTHSYT